MPILEGSQRPENSVAYVEESDISVPSLSLRDFLAVLRRRKAIAINTFILIIALGVVLTLMTKPVFLSTARIQVEGRANLFAVNASSVDPLSSLFEPQNNPSVQTQVEILRSPEILKQVYKQSGTTNGSVKLDVRRVDDTDIIELTGTSNSSAAVEGFIKAMPQVYLKKTGRDRISDVEAALDFAARSLKSEREKLNSTEKKLQGYKDKQGVVDNVGEKEAAISQLGKAKADLVSAQSNAAQTKAQLDALVATRNATPKFLDSPTTTTNSQVQILKDQLAQLQNDRQKLLYLYTPEDDQVKQKTLEIQTMERRIAQTPATVTNNSRALNPAVAELDSKIADARSSWNAATANLGSIQGNASKLQRRLSSFNIIDYQLASLLRDQTQGNSAVTTLDSTVRELTLRHEGAEN